MPNRYEKVHQIFLKQWKYCGQAVDAGGVKIKREMILQKEYWLQSSIAPYYTTGLIFNMGITKGNVTHHKWRNYRRGISIVCNC